MNIVSKLILIVFIFLDVKADVFIREKDKNIKKLYHIKKIIKKIEKERTETRLREFLKDTRPGRFPGTPGHNKAILYIKTWMGFKAGNFKLNEQVFTPNQELATKFYQQDFDLKVRPQFKPQSKEYGKWLRYTNMAKSLVKHAAKNKGRNLIYTKKGKSEKKIILAAHYDSLAINKEKMNFDLKAAMPGADNNASGVIALMSVAEILSQIDLSYTIEIIFFDMQQTGFMGSEYYVSKSKLGDIEGMINVLMIGHDTKIFDKKKKHGNFKAYIARPINAHYKKHKAFAEKLLNNQKKISGKTKFELSEIGFPQGNNIHFESRGVPSITLTQNWEDDFNTRGHHSDNDFAETINFKSLNGSIQTILGLTLSYCFF